jgi:hypothetical protein
MFGIKPDFVTLTILIIIYVVWSAIVRRYMRRANERSLTPRSITEQFAPQQLQHSEAKVQVPLVMRITNAILVFFLSWTLMMLFIIVVLSAIPSSVYVQFHDVLDAAVGLLPVLAGIFFAALSNHRRFKRG